MLYNKLQTFAVDSVDFFIVFITRVYRINATQNLPAVIS